MTQGRARDLVTRYEDLEDLPSNPSSAATLGDIVSRRFGRRELVQGATLARSSVGWTRITISRRATRPTY